jgi:alpha-D-ribose 1-methylphosphonate 5-triphosphate synthase subunit PhnL
MSQPAIVVKDLAKTFKLFNPVEAEIPVFETLDLSVEPGECVCLVGASGTGKSTLMRSVYGNYLPSGGSVSILDQGEFVELVDAKPAAVLELRRRTLGYVSQFLHVIPRIPTIDIVMEPLLENGVDKAEAQDRAVVLLRRLRLPENLWSIPPATFSGGEQQRVNIARSFIRNYPVMLLDEPTASLDFENRETVVELIKDRLSEGVAMIGIFHDQDVRDAVATRLFEIKPFTDAA